MSKSLRPPLPRTRRAWLLVAAAALIVAIAGFAGVYFVLFNGSSAAPLSLSKSATANGHLDVATVAGTWSMRVLGHRIPGA